MADADNHAVRRVTMAGAVSTVAGTKEGGCVDGPCALARFNKPTSIVVDGDGVIVVAGCSPYWPYEIPPRSTLRIFLLSFVKCMDSSADM